MTYVDYTYIFGAVQHRMSRVLLQDHCNRLEREFHVALNDEELLDNWNAMSPLLSDMADLAVAVSVADRLSKRYGDRPYEIRVELPVRHTTWLDNHTFQERLQDLLYRFTGDYWTFSFYNGSDYQRWTQLRLDTEPGCRVEVGLWSGGLDSAAGLYNRALSDTADRYVLFGTGANTHVHAIQNAVAQAVHIDFPNRTRLVRALISMSDTRAMPKHSHQRSRGFVFLLLGAVCAQLAGQDRLHIYENGIGSLNLPYRASEVGLDHARSVHPVSLWEMGEIVSLLLDKPFEFENPFVFATKAEMCQVFVAGKYRRIPALTFSCDSRHRQDEFPTACGFCSSCLLRRQALIVCGGENSAKYVVPHGRQPRLGDGQHLSAMMFQVDVLKRLLGSANPWASMVSRYAQLDEVADRLAQAMRLPITEVRERLVGLYHRYAAEWDGARKCLLADFCDVPRIAA